jgi:NADH-quinone oxidoreductase subunit G
MSLAPAVRVALGEAFGLPPGANSTGKIVAALKMLGADKVYDTGFTADMTIIEETNEFVKRFTSGQRLPLFTSCCPAWVKFVEMYYPDLLQNLSTCKSPQQMFGSVCKEEMARTKGIPSGNVTVVSIMPCTAKKFEAARPEFEYNGIRDIDYVLTTQELITMIEEAGIHFNDIEPESFDLPFGFKTGAGVIFGNSGGVTEAVLRYAQELLTGEKKDNSKLMIARGEPGIREAKITIEGADLSVVIVSGLGNARKVIEGIKSGEKDYNLIEVMACPGGCVGGGGQPVSREKNYLERRTKGLYENDNMQVLHKSQDNPYLEEYYRDVLISPGSKIAHEMLHTRYHSRKRIAKEGIHIIKGKGTTVVDITICFGTGCMMRGSQRLLQQLLDYIKENNIQEGIDVKASFCFEACDRGPVVQVNEQLFERTSMEMLLSVLSILERSGNTK